MSELELGPLFYCGDEVHHGKVEKIQAALQARHLDGLLLLKHDAVRYVTEFYAKGYRPFLDLEYAALVSPDRDPVLGFTIGGEERRAAIRSRVGEARRLPGVRGWAGALAQILRDYDLAAGRVGFDFMPHFIYQGLQADLPALDLVDAADIWIDISAIKHPLEVAVIEEALALVQTGIRTAIDVVAPEVSEIEVSAAAEYVMRLGGSEMNPFIPVVASGPNAAIWERIATPRKISDGDMVILDFGCVVRGYTGDFARTIIVGDPTPEQRRLYSAAYDALQRAIEAIKPGVPCGAIDQLVRDAIREAGFERYAQPWASGHQLGFGLHGEPLLGPGVETPLQPGMVINLEPSLYTYDDLSVGGVELEDTVLVTEDGYRLLTDFPYDQLLLNRPVPARAGTLCPPEGEC